MSVGRGAGEMKGVSMEDNKKQLAALKQLLERPENRACADCSGGGAASRATWASINTGAFICMRCAGPSSPVSARSHVVFGSLLVNTSPCHWRWCAILNTVLISERHHAIMRAEHLAALRRCWIHIQELDIRS